MTREEIKQKIRLAFADTPYPGDDEIGAPNGRDDARIVTERLRGKKWQNVAPETLWQFGLNYMTPKAFRYYLPAYLLAEYEHQSLNIESNLTPPELASSGHSSLYDFHEMFKDFTDGEKQSVSAFVDDLYDEVQECHSDPASPDLEEEEERFWLALRDYWRQF